MYPLYSFFLGAWILAMVPVSLYRAWRYRKYLPGLSQRMGRLPDALRSDGRPTLWFHTCSVGETLSIQPLVNELYRIFPDARFVFSTITRTGQEIAMQRFAKYGSTFYFPLDLAHIARRVLNTIKPAVIVIVDTEIWPNVLLQAHRQGIPVIMVNGRISEHSFHYYRLVRSFLRKVFTNYRMFLMQSEEDAARIRLLGAEAEKVLVSGNMKYDREPAEKELSEAVALSLDKALGLTEGRGGLIVAGSTHTGEEEILLEVIRRVRMNPGLENTRLLLAPRHPERFDAVAELAARYGFNVVRRSEAAGSTGVDVMILDTLGELAAAYRFATVAFVGGTLIPHGGQNIMEPAWHARPIIVGSSMENFRHTLKDFLARGAVRQIQSTDADKEGQIRELTDVFTLLLSSSRLREEMGRAAYSVFEDGRGATRFTMDRVAALYEEIRGAVVC